MLRIPAYELSEWEVYERLYGELGPGRLDNTFAYQTMRLIAAQPVPEGSDDRPLVIQMFMAPHGERRIADKDIEKRRFDAEIEISERAYAQVEDDDEDEDAELDEPGDEEL